MNVRNYFHGLILLAIVIFQIISTDPVYASGTVGNGTPVSCTEEAFNSALSGGGLITFNCGGAATINFTSTKVITSNTQINGGGLISLSGNNSVRLFTVNSPANLELSNLTISDGYVVGDGGAIQITSGATVNISNSTLSDNGTMNGYGGAIYVGGGTLNVTNSTFSNNNANVENIGIFSLGGGAIQNNDGTVTISRSTFNGNSVTSHTGDGGAIYNGDFDNGFIGDDTGIPDANPDVLTITNSTFYNNRLLNTSGIPSSGNAGGAVRSSSVLTITNSTFTDNDSGTNGPNAEAGAVLITHGTVTLTDNIFANSSGADCAIRIDITSRTSTGNLIENNHPQYGGCGTPAVSGDPILGAPQNNGGPTMTVALSPLSPAVDALDSCNAATDQRGVVRPQGSHCDIGAYELDSSSPLVTNVTSTAANRIYGLDNVINIDMYFSEVVNVSGTPLLALETGTTDRTASYSGGSGSNILTFAYTVQTGDMSADLDYASANALDLNGGTIQDVATNPADLTLPDPGAANSLSANKNIIIATNIPHLLSIARQNPAASTTSADVLVFRISFSETVINVSGSDFKVTGPSSVNKNVNPINGSTYDVTVSGGNLAGFNGIVGLDLDSGQNITDSLGIPLPMGEPAIDETYTLDNSYPSVISIQRVNASPSAAISVAYTVTFSEAVTGVDAADFSLLTSGIKGASITGVTGSSSTYTVTINTGAGNGQIRLNVVDNDSIKDALNNALGGNGAGNGNFNNGEVYQILKGADTVGVFRPSNGIIFLKNTNVTGFADIAINYGQGGDYPVTGDWDGDGDDTIGVYRNGSFYLRNANTVGFADVAFAFGKPGDQPIAGDWNGDGIDTIGVFDRRTFTFYLRNSNSAGPAEAVFALGIPGDIGIAGDWNGDGKDTVGVFRPSNGIIFLKNTNTAGFADIGINYGQGGDKPVTGDWNNDGIDTIGVLRGNTFLLRNSNTVGFADISFALGLLGDMPIAGNWDGKP